MTTRTIIALATLAFTSASARAQEYRPTELGMDAGVSIRLGDNSVTFIDFPVQAFRIGFFVDDKVSIEPKFGISVVTGSGETFTSYAGELGLLYHFYREEEERRGRVVYPRMRDPRSAFYVRPFVEVVGSSGGGHGDADALLGAGLGLKVPLVSRLATRFEANFARRFGDQSSSLIGLLAGLSFFTR